MKRKLTACLLIFAIWVLFPVTVWAQETTLTTKVPSSHRLQIDIAGKGEVIVDGISCKQSCDLQIQRGTTPQIAVKPANRSVVKSAILNDVDITQQLRKGTYKMPQMCFDGKLTVVFQAVPGAPQAGSAPTGDCVPVMALSVTMALSLTAALFCLLLQKKKKS